MNDQANFTRLDSDLHTLGALVAGNLAPDAVPADRWPAITALALQHGLAPMLHWTLKQAGCDLDANPAWQPLIRARYQTAIDWALKERAQLEIDAALRAAGIPALWLKGSILARTVYLEPSLRPMSDLDVLVPYEQREAALSVVRKMGFDFFIQSSPIPHRSNDLLRWQAIKDYHLIGGVNNNVHLELHFQLLNDALPPSQMQWFWDQQKSIELSHGTLLRGLSPEAHLLYLAAHAVLHHGEENVYLLRYLDLHQMVIQLSLAWNVILVQAVQMEWAIILERALLNAIEYFSTTVPQETLDELAVHPLPKVTNQISKQPTTISRWEKIQSYFAPLSIVDRFRLLFQLMCPPSKYMRWRYNIRDRFPVWPYYLYRWFDQGQDAVREVWRRFTQRK